MNDLKLDEEGHNLYRGKEKICFVALGGLNVHMDLFFFVLGV